MVNEVSNNSRGFVKRLIGFSSASWISAAISFISTPIITRLFLPQEVGKINLFTIQMIRYHHGKLLAYISRKIAEYFWWFSKSTPSLSGKVVRHVWSEECCAFSLTKDMILLSMMSYFVKLKRDNENYYRSIFYYQAFFNRH